jgi:hypothetical protein
MPDAKQLGLFNFPTSEPVKQEAPKTLTREELWELFRAEYESARLFQYRQPAMVEIPEIRAITEMARMQVQCFETSKRTRQDADNISMLGKVAWSFFLGESAEKVFEDWSNALGKGNKGVFWQWPGESVGLRTTSGDKTRFSITRNRYSDRITAYAFARVQLQHKGAAFVEVLGWAHRYKLAGLIRDHGPYLTVDINAIKREGLLLPATQFKQLMQEEN